jgi:hypothetical protein
MSKSDQFRQYAEEAILNASQCKNESEKKALTDLAHFWALAAFQSDRAGLAVRHPVATSATQ